MTGTFGLLRARHDRSRGSGVDRVEHEHLRALGERGLGLLLLLGRVLIGVRVDDLAVRAQLLELALEVAAGPATRSGRSWTPAAGARSSRSPPPSRHRRRLRRCSSSSLPHAASARPATSRVSAHQQARLLAVLLNIRIPPRVVDIYLYLLPALAGSRPAATRGPACWSTSATAPSSSARSPELAGDDLHVLGRARDRPQPDRLVHRVEHDLPGLRRCFPRRRSAPG